MKKLLMSLLMMFALSTMVFAQAAQKPAPPAPKDSGHALSMLLGVIEREVVSAAEAMPAEKYDFKPTQGAFTDVRTYGDQFRHIGFVNYMFGSTITGEKNPLTDAGGENGPALKTKDEIVKQLKDSFAYLHKSLETLNASNEVDIVELFGMKMPKVNIASLAIAHPLDHYGQAVVYLRMNDIIPPASRPQPKK